MECLQDFLDREIICRECGRTHEVGVQFVDFGEDAVATLAGWLGRHLAGRRVVLVGDKRTLRVAGIQAEEALSSEGFGVRTLTIQDAAGGGDPVCDRATVETVCRGADAADLLVACGSGVVNDLTKWASWMLGKPYAVVPTALSMNGYVSANVAPLLDGVKSLIHAHEPVGVAALPWVLKEAPADMTAAGLGDVVAKSVSTMDWSLNAYLFGEYHCAYCAGLASDIEPIYMDDPEGIRERSDQGMKALFDALILTGFSMTMAGTSSPASGGEHLISHSLDMMARRDGIKHDFHGRQVGVGTIFCAALYQELCAMEQPQAVVPQAGCPEDFWGAYADAVQEKYAEKRRRERQAANKLKEGGATWTALRQVMAESVPSPARLKNVLKRAGAAHRIADIGVEKARFVDAVTHGHEMRERFTVLGLARCFGILPDMAGELVDRWLIDEGEDDG